MREAKAQTRMRTCAVSSEPLLFIDATSTRIPRVDLYREVLHKKAIISYLMSSSKRNQLGLEN